MNASSPLLTMLQIAIAVGGAIGLRQALEWPVLGCVMVAVVASYPLTALVAVAVGLLRR